MPSIDAIDIDAVVAVADVVARSGGREFEIGYLDEDVPVEQARWYAQARYQGSLIFVDEKAGPDEAADALARQILGGARCTFCGKTVTVSWRAGYCWWHRDGDAWVQGCTGKRRATKEGSP